MLSRFYLIAERYGRTDGHICYINIARSMLTRVSQHAKVVSFTYFLSEAEAFCTFGHFILMNGYAYRK